MSYLPVKIGENFQTFDNDKGQNKHGIGLGLNICNTIARKIGNLINLGPMNGLMVKSYENKGTVVGFFVYAEDQKDFKKD